LGEWSLHKAGAWCPFKLAIANRRRPYETTFLEGGPQALALARWAIGAPEKNGAPESVAAGLYGLVSASLLGFRTAREGRRLGA